MKPRRIKAKKKLRVNSVLQLKRLFHAVMWSWSCYICILELNGPVSEWWVLRAKSLVIGMQVHG